MYHKSTLARRMKRSWHSYDVNGNEAKTGDTLSVHCHFSGEIKAVIALHEQGFIQVFNYDLQKCVNAYCLPMIMYMGKCRKSWKVYLDIQSLKELIVTSWTFLPCQSWNSGSILKTFTHTCISFSRRLF